MAYKCLQCGHIFECGEERKWTEIIGECWGAPCTEERAGCPLCKGEYESMVECEICGSEHLESDLTSGVCPDCIERWQNDIRMCAKIGAHDTEIIEINGFLATKFSAQDINDILLDQLIKVNDLSHMVDCTKYVNNDREWFALRLTEEVTQE